MVSSLYSKEKMILAHLTLFQLLNFKWPRNIRIVLTLPLHWFLLASICVQLGISKWMDENNRTNEDKLELWAFLNFKTIVLKFGHERNVKCASDVAIVCHHVLQCSALNESHHKGALMSSVSWLGMLHCVSFPAVHNDNEHCSFHLSHGEGPDCWNALQTLHTSFPEPR